jgi:Fe-S-cluster-containing hydrogenase component 2
MIVVNSDLCPKNHRCPTIRVCPARAISQQPSQAPVVDQAKCTGCGQCVLSCSVFSLKNEMSRPDGS